MGDCRLRNCQENTYHDLPRERAPFEVHFTPRSPRPGLDSCLEHAVHALVGDILVCVAGPIVAGLIQLPSVERREMVGVIPNATIQGGAIIDQFGIELVPKPHPCFIDDCAVPEAHVHLPLDNVSAAKMKPMIVTHDEKN